MVTDMQEISTAIKEEMTTDYRKAADQFKTDGNFDVMQAAFAVLDAKVAETAKTRGEAAAEEERKVREGRDKAREDYGKILLSAFTPVWTSQQAAALKKVAETNPALRFASVQIDIKRETEGEGDAAKSIVKIADPRAIMSMSSSTVLGEGAGKGRRGLEVVVSINGTNHTYQSVNAAAQAILKATSNTNKETLISEVAKLDGYKMVSVGGNAVA